MNEAQHNYDIYNKELLGLREMLRHWCQYLFQPQHKVRIYTNHANVLFWKNTGEHNRRVARWHAELMEYDFELVHIAGARNGWADALSRRPDYDKGDDDNKKLVVLPEHFFAPAVQARLAGTEWADPNNPEECVTIRRIVAGLGLSQLRIEFSACLEISLFGKFESLCQIGSMAK